MPSNVLWEYKCVLRTTHPTSWPANQAIKQRIGKNPVSAIRTNIESMSASKIIEVIPGQIIGIGDESNSASITPMPWPLSKALETISGAKPNKTAPGRDIATTENHIASRAAPRFGQMRQTTYNGTKAQLIKAKSPGNK